MLTTILAGFFSLFGFGLIVAFLGSIKLQLAQRLKMDNSQFGQIIAAFQWIMVIMAIGSGIFIDNVGHQVAISLGAILAALSIYMMGRARSVKNIMGYCALLGIGGQLLYAGGNTLLPTIFTDPAAGSNLGNAFFGLGALLMSLITAMLFKRMNFDRALSIVALLLLIPLVFALLGNFPSTEYGFDAMIALSLLSNYVVWISALLLFCYIGLEVSMGAWITSLATELNADETQASRTLSVFLIAIMLSRLVFGLQDRLTGLDLTPLSGYVLVGAGIAAILALSVLMHTRSLAAARGWIFLMGFTLGPVFPTTIAMTLEHFAPSTWGTLFGVIATAGSMGAVVLPVWIGNLSTARTVQSSFGLLRGAAIGFSTVALVLNLLPLA